MNRFLWPLVGFVSLIALLAIGLNLDPHEVPSPLVGRAAPSFSLARLDSPERHFSPDEMRGKVWLLNVWASWCVSCRQEHSVLVEMAKDPAIILVGLNYKEVRGDGEFDMDTISAAREKEMGFERARLWLKKHGNPYAFSALDLDGRVGIDYGVYGVPETYLIDKEGFIRMKHTGPLNRDVFIERIQPLITELSK